MLYVKGVKRRMETAFFEKLENLILSPDILNKLVFD